MIRFDADTSLITAQAADGTEPARIAGIAVPWDTVATVSGGEKVRFARGSFDVGQKAAKLVENHDLTQLRGIVSSLTDGDDGLEFEATLADTRASRDAIALLKAGAYDAVSVGAQPTKFTTDAEGVMTVTEAQLVELSLVAVPAYSEAVITDIAAEAPADTDEQGQQDQQETENTEQEQAEMSEAKIEAEPIEAEATIPTSPIIYAQKPELPTPVEYLSALFKGGAEFEKVQRAVMAAAPEVATADTPGILPTPIVGPAYNGYVGSRPVCDAIGVRAMPGGGKVFIRPKVTTHTSMGIQHNEFDQLNQGTFVVDDIQVTKGTYGGYVNVSEQDLDWTDPAVLNLILDDMGRLYAAATEDVAAGDLVSAASYSEGFGATGDLDDPVKWATWIGAAAQDILSTSDGHLPTHLFVSPDIWGYLLGLSDTADRPLFPQLGPMNAVGTLGPQSLAGTAFGLSVVVSRWFPSETLIMGNADGYELYEQQKGAITADNPTDLSRTIAWRGYFATCMIDAGKFVTATFS